MTDKVKFEIKCAYRSINRVSRTLTALLSQKQPSNTKVNPCVICRCMTRTLTPDCGMRNVARTPSTASQDRPGSKHATGGKKSLPASGMLSHQPSTMHQRLIPSVLLSSMNSLELIKDPGPQHQRFAWLFNKAGRPCKHFHLLFQFPLTISSFSRGAGPIPS